MLLSPVRWRHGSNADRRRVPNQRLNGSQESGGSIYLNRSLLMVAEKKLSVVQRGDGREIIFITPLKVAEPSAFGLVLSQYLLPTLKLLSSIPFRTVNRKVRWLLMLKVK
jgi:hypothetical protein